MQNLLYVYKHDLRFKESPLEQLVSIMRYKSDEEKREGKRMEKMRRKNFS